MSTLFGKPFSSPKNINVKGQGTTRGGIVLFTGTNALAPLTGSTSNYLYTNGSNELVYVSQGAATTIGAAGGGATPTWETIFASDNTFTITPDTTWTIAGNRATGTDVVTFTNIGGGSGDVIKIQNAGSGADISGTSDTWTITKAGAATFAGLTPGGDITTTALAVDWDLVDNNASALSFDAAGKAGILALVTTNGAEGVTMSGTLGITGQLDLGAESNTVVSLIVQDDTITTFGNGTTEDQGMIVFSSDTLTTGDLLRLQLDESALNGGAFIKCVQTDAAAAVFTVGENGITTIAGAAASNMLTITAGDMVMSDGSLTITDADNAASFSVTNNTATTASVIALAGSGVFTGTTTSSFMTITPSGLTTGTAFTITAAALTTGVALGVTANAATTSAGVITLSTTGLTSGSAFLISGGGANLLAAGSCLEIAMGAATAGAGLEIVTTGVYAGAGALSVTADSATTGTIMFLSADGLTTGTGLDLTSTGTIVTTGEMLNVVANSATTSTGLVRVSGTSLTDGWAMQLTGGGTAITASGGVLDIVTGASTNGSAIRIVNTGAIVAASVGLVMVTANSLTTGDVYRLSATAQTTGNMIHATGGGANLASGGAIFSAAMGAAIAGSAFEAVTTGVYTGSDGVLSVVADSATTGTLAVISGNGLTTGTGLLLTSSGILIGGGEMLSVVANSATTCTGVIRASATSLTDGFVMELTGGGANATATGGVLNLSIGAATAGSALCITNTGAYAGTTGVVDINAAFATTGTIMDMGVNSLTTGTALNISTADSLTTGAIANFVSNSADATARNLMFIHNNHASAVGAVPLALRNDGPTSTNYFKILTLGNGSNTVTLWQGNGTTANGNLSGTAGDVLFNGGSNKIEYCTGTTNWTATV